MARLNLLDNEVVITDTNWEDIRIVPGALATNTANNRPALLEIDLHYEKNSIGSDNELTKTF